MTTTPSNTRFGAPRCAVRAALLLLAFALAALLHPPAARAGDDSPWSVAFKTKFMLNSQTSYQFGNPFAPYQVPLSRLEFDMDATWAGFEARRQLGRVSVGLGYLSTVRDQNAGQLRDYDWDDDTAPHVLTIFSASSCRMRPSYQFQADADLRVSDVLGLPSAVDLRPVVGFRGQQLRFMAHDGVQYTYDAAGNITSATDFAGDAIKFKQNWHQYFAGLRLGYDWDQPPLVRTLRVNSQLDISYVEGKNRDDHLLRGDRVTRDITYGHAWHAMAGLALGLTEGLDLGLELDYLRIETRGTHKFLDKTLGVGLNWLNGVRAWSEQTSVSLTLDYRF